jgi:hypothetical protein
MAQDSIGFSEEPKNGNGIIRAQTTLQIRSWHMPRTDKALEKFNAEIAKTEFPGIYILFAKSKVYIGEAKNLYNRLKTHMATPDEKIKDWKEVLVMNDGRFASQSEFNDTVVRKALEFYLIKLLKANKYVVVSQGERQILNSSQRHTVDSLTSELNTFLLKKNIITKVLEEHGQEEVFPDELKKILEKSGKKVTKWHAHDAVIDGKTTFIRPGSAKPKGWQITFRDRFLAQLAAGEGFLLVSRDGVLLIPMREVQEVVTEYETFEIQNTIDIYIAFKEDKVTLSYKDQTIDVTQYKLTS